MKKIVSSHYLHIDNGGPCITLETDENKLGTTMTLETGYYGYPNISMDFYMGTNHIEILEMLRDTITKHIAKLKMTQ